MVLVLVLALVLLYVGLPATPDKPVVLGMVLGMVLPWCWLYHWFYCRYI